MRSCRWGRCLTASLSEHRLKAREDGLTLQFARVSVGGLIADVCLRGRGRCRGGGEAGRMIAEIEATPRSRLAARAAARPKARRISFTSTGPREPFALAQYFDLKTCHREPHIGADVSEGLNIVSNTSSIDATEGHEKALAGGTRRGRSYSRESRNLVWMSTCPLHPGIGTQVLFGACVARPAPA